MFCGRVSNSPSRLFWFFTSLVSLLWVFVLFCLSRNEILFGEGAH